MTRRKTKGKNKNENQTTTYQQIIKIQPQNNLEEKRKREQQNIRDKIDKKIIWTQYYK